MKVITTFRVTIGLLMVTTVTAWAQLATQPTVQPTNLVFSNVTSTSFDYDFTDATGTHDGYLHLRKAGSPPTFVPIDGVEYSVGQVLSDGSIVQYNDNIATGNTVSDLTPGTTYFFRIYVYNGAGATTNYLTTGPLSGSVTTTSTGLATEPTASPTGLTFSAIAATSYSYTFTAASPAPDGYIHIRRAGSAPTDLPVDGVVYTPVQNLGSSQVLYVGTGTSFDQGSAVTGTTYHYAIYAFNGTGSSINYRTVSPATGTITPTTLAPEPTAPPTNFVASSRTTTSFDYEFTDAAGSHDGYLHLMKEGSAPTFVPVDGVEYSSGDVMPDGSEVQFNDNIATGNSASGLTPGTTYHFKIYVYNGFGSETNYLNSNPLIATVTTLVPDSDPPVVTDSTPTTVDQGATVKVSANVTDSGSGVDYVIVYYKKITGSDDDILSADMNNTTGSTWEFTIPTSAIDVQGVDYEIYAYDLNGNEFVGPVKQVRVRYPDLTVSNIPSGSDQNSYRIVSVPLVLEKKTVKDIFEDDLGPLDPKTWRLFRYQAGINTELTSTSPIDIGRGYWFLNKQAGKTIDLGAGVAADAGLGKDFTIPISTGWNQIGNPFNVDVAWADVVASNPGLGQLRTFTGSWNNGTVLTRFSGGFVNVPASAGITQIIIPVSKSSRSIAPVDFRQPLDNAFWAVDLQVLIGDQAYDLGGIGMHPEASNDYDGFDGFTLPRFFDYIELSHTKQLEGIHYSKDIIQPAQRQEWQFAIQSNLQEKQTLISWDNTYFGDNDKALVLWDEAEQRAIDMKQVNKYAFDRHAGGRFRIFYGDPEFIREKTIPNRVVFHTVFPNPASERVAFAYSTPPASDLAKGTVEIYNLLGQKVATLPDCPADAGYHEVVWNIEGEGKPQAGVYISVLKFGKAIAQQRLVIK